MMAGRGIEAQADGARWLWPFCMVVMISRFAAIALVPRESGLPGVAA